MFLVVGGALWLAHQVPRFFRGVATRSEELIERQEEMNHTLVVLTAVVMQDQAKSMKPEEFESWLATVRALIRSTNGRSGSRSRSG